MRTVMVGKYLNNIVKAVDSAGRSEGLIELRDGYILVRSEGPSSVLMSAIMIPENQMEHYERNGYEFIGVNLEHIDTFVRDGDDRVEMRMEERTLILEDESAHAEIATLEPSSVAGRTDKSLNVDYEVTLKGDPSFIIDFIKRGEELTGSDSYMIGVRDEGVYLYMTGDNARYDDFIPKEEFDTFSTNWEVNNQADFGGLSPEKDKGIDVLFSTEFSKYLDMPSSSATMSFGNHIPMKFVFDDLGEKEGKPMKLSYFQTPRLDKTGDMKTLPDRVLNK